MKKNKARVRSSEKLVGPDLEVYGIRWMIGTHFREVEGILDNLQEKYEGWHKAASVNEQLLKRANARILELEAELALLKSASQKEP